MKRLILILWVPVVVVSVSCRGERPTAPAPPLSAGRPWGEAEAYLSRLAFAGGEEAHTARVRVCPSCRTATLTLRPERGAHRLTPAALRDSMRVIARIDADTPAFVPALGLREGARHRTAWLLTDGRHRAVALYDSAGRVAFGPPWLLEVTPGAPAPGPRARWRPVGEGTGIEVPPGILSDLSAAWVACGGGGCTALPLR